MRKCVILLISSLLAFQNSSFGMKNRGAKVKSSIVNFSKLKLRIRNVMILSLDLDCVFCFGSKFYGNVFISS